MRIHHLEIACQSLQQRLKTFVGCFGSEVICRHAKDKAVLLKLGPLNIVLKENESVTRDTVQNIAIEVDDVGKVYQSAYNLDSNNIVTPPKLLTDVSPGQTSGSVHYAVVKSPVGNIMHTLLNTKSYKGAFLPGYIEVPHGDNDIVLHDNQLGPDITNPAKCRNDTNASNTVIGIDHITFAVHRGTSFPHMEWYKQCFGFSRLLVNNEEKNEGFIVKTKNNIGDSLGLRITALQEHLCSELALNMGEPGTQDGIKLVFAESLHGQGPNQIDNFLFAHEGPGIQHIGLLTEDICTSASQWKQNGVSFLTPPIHYYSEVKDVLLRLPEKISSLNIQKHGILVDSEGDLMEENSNFLLQVFTQPIFDRNTFFFELIQRHGAVGFGAGNVAALWRAVDAYLREKGDAENDCNTENQHCVPR